MDSPCIKKESLKLDFAVHIKEWHHYPCKAKYDCAMVVYRGMYLEPINGLVHALGLYFLMDLCALKGSLLMYFWHTSYRICYTKTELHPNHQSGL